MTWPKSWIHEVNAKIRLLHFLGYRPPLSLEHSLYLAFRDLSELAYCTPQHRRLCARIALAIRARGLPEIVVTARPLPAVTVAPIPAAPIPALQPTAAQPDGWDTYTETVQTALGRYTAVKRSRTTAHEIATELGQIYLTVSERTGDAALRLSGEIGMGRERGEVLSTVPFIVAIDGEHRIDWDVSTPAFVIDRVGLWFRQWVERSDAERAEVAT